MTTEQRPTDVILPPVVVSIPEETELPATVEEPGMEVFASASAGIPIWPTAIMAEQTTRDLATSSHNGVIAVNYQYTGP